MSTQLTPVETQSTMTGTIARTGHGGLRGAWSRIRSTVREMNYASRRVVELNAPWTVDKDWHLK